MAKKPERKSQSTPDSADVREAKKSQRIAEDEEDNRDDGDAEKEVGEEELSRWESCLNRVFDRVIVDEAHWLKSALTLTNRAIAYLLRAILILITGTPIVEKAADHYGLPVSIYRALLNPDEKAPELEDYDNWKRIGRSHYLHEPADPSEAKSLPQTGRTIKLVQESGEEDH